MLFSFLAICLKSGWVTTASVLIISPSSINLNFEERCALVLQAAGKRLNLYFMHGNRDFLVGEQMMSTCNASLLTDPTVLTFLQQRYLLTHGDMLCLADTQYFAFRDVVRQPAWQQAQLAKPLAERQAIGRHMRAESQKNQQNLLEYADVDDAAAHRMASKLQTLKQ